MESWTDRRKKYQGAVTTQKNAGKSFRKQLRLVLIALYILLNKSDEREKARESERERELQQNIK